MNDSVSSVECVEKKYNGLQGGFMRDTLKAGLEHVLTYRVPENKTVPHLYPESPLFRQMPKVFATGFMVGLMEWACMEALAPHLEPGEGSVGTLVNVTHTAATPPGMTVTVRVRCAGVDGRRSIWEVEASDDVEAIGKGSHERFTVDIGKFNARVAKKAGGA
jgi:fluoroacetyl-CoA thioesterase